MGKSIAFVLGAWLLAAAGARGEAPPFGRLESDEGPVLVEGEKRVLRLFPSRELYPAAVADFHRPGFALLHLSTTSVGVAESGRSRFDLRLGGVFALLGSEPRVDRKGGWQVGVFAGFDSQFDIDNSFDNIGWDGNYGLVWMKARGPWAFRLGVYHTSSHVGDEYAERTGRLRIGYTREELLASLSRRLGERWRVYSEAGWGYTLRNEELQEPGRLQLGLEYESLRSLWKDRLGWYTAFDASAMEERDWRVDTALAGGLLIVSGPRRWRLGLAFYDGRSPLGEFFQDTERYIAFGLWLDV